MRCKRSFVCSELFENTNCYYNNAATDLTFEVQIQTGDNQYNDNVAVNDSRLLVFTSLLYRVSPVQIYIFLNIKISCFYRNSKVISVYFRLSTQPTHFTLLTKYQWQNHQCHIFSCLSLLFQVRNGNCFLRVTFNQPTPNTPLYQMTWCVDTFTRVSQ